jgi:hypothetical protein
MSKTPAGASGPGGRAGEPRGGSTQATCAAAHCVVPAISSGAEPGPAPPDGLPAPPPTTAAAAAAAAAPLLLPRFSSCSDPLCPPAAPATLLSVPLVGGPCSLPLPRTRRAASASPPPPPPPPPREAQLLLTPWLVDPTDVGPVMPAACWCDDEVTDMDTEPLMALCKPDDVDGQALLGWLAAVAAPADSRHNADAGPPLRLSRSPLAAPPAAVLTGEASWWGGWAASGVPRGARPVAKEGAAGRDRGEAGLLALVPTDGGWLGGGSGGGAAPPAAGTKGEGSGAAAPSAELNGDHFSATSACVAGGGGAAVWDAQAVRHAPRPEAPLLHPLRAPLR